MSSPEPRPRQVSLYDFRRPNKFNRDHQRALQIASETFARHFTTTLSTVLRAVSSVNARPVGQLTYDEYIREIPNPSYLAVLSMEPLDGRSLFHIPLPLIMTAVDRLLGGTGFGPEPVRPLTDIEDSLARGLLRRTLHELAYAFESLTPIQPVLVNQESNPQFAQVASAPDMVVLMPFDIKIGGTQGEASLCIPFASLQPVLDEVTANAFDSKRTVTDPRALGLALRGVVAQSSVDVSVRLSSITLQSQEIVELTPGDIVPFHHAVDRPLNVAVAGVERFAAIAGRRGKRLACVIVDPDISRNS
jgi:flagellar motor switch protein FliM